MHHTGAWMLTDTTDALREAIQRVEDAPALFSALRRIEAADELRGA